jgi:peroxiredoxin Q/BCP
MRLTDLRGRWVVLFFYPRIGAASAAAARELRDRSGDFRRQQAQVLGVGCDSREAQREFARSLGLNFPLLSDPSSRVARRYGVWREKSSNGRAWIGLVRSTFLIDPSGRLARVLDNQRVKGHADKVLRALRAARSRD